MIKADIHLIVGTRPNFIKAAAILHEYNKNKLFRKLKIQLIHTGQHFDKKMSKIFFQEFNFKNIKFLNASKSNEIDTFNSIIKKYNLYIKKNTPKIVVVFGDVNSTLAVSIVAKKNYVQLAHIESGLRSLDRKMPEEINRIMTDSITDIFFTTSEVANKNLIKEGISRKKIYFVGNTMINTLINNRHKISYEKFKKFNDKKIILLTIHRPSNLENNSLQKILEFINPLTKKYNLIFPIHPRTKKILEKSQSNFDINFIEPLGYLEMMGLLSNSIAIFTDSGGITEESYFFNVPTFCLRDNTERPETITHGTNYLIGSKPWVKYKKVENLLKIKKKKKRIKYWDSKVGYRILENLQKIILR